MDYKISRASTKFRYGMSDPNQVQEWLRDEQPIGVSFIGRSNVGKSSTINALFGNKTARISKTPGRTREINIFEFNLELEGRIVESLPSFYLFDLPGYGHAKVSKEMAKQWDVLMSTFFQNSNEDMLMLNLQDARHPNQAADKEFRKYLQPFGFDTIMLFNKIDKLKKQKERAALQKMKPEIFEENKWVQQIHFTSAESKQGLPEVERSIISYLLHKLEIQED